MKQKQDKITISSRIRNIIYDRDGFACRICGSTHNLSINHIIPRGLGRNHDYCNLVLVCEQDHRFMERGMLPHWWADSPAKLFHTNPVKAYTHYINFKEIICKTHGKPLDEQFNTEPIIAYKRKGRNPIF